MNIYKLPFNHDLKLVLLKFKLKTNNNCNNNYYDNYFEWIKNILNSNKLFDCIKENQIQILGFKDTNFENLKLLELLEFLMSKNIYNFKIYLFYFETNIFLPSINVTKILSKDKNLKNISKKYMDLLSFFNKKKEFKDIISKAIIENKVNSTQLEKIIKKNKFLKFDNFQKLNIQLSKLLNLFSVFGTINNVYYNFLDGTIYIEYKEEFELNRIIFNKKMWIYDKIKLNILKSIPELKNYSFFKYIKSIKVDNKINRFNNKIKTRYNAPSRILNFSNINYGSKMFKLYNIVKVIAKPTLLKFNFLKTGKTKMCLIKFDKISDSIKILINLNNIILDKRKLKISFSFNKFDI